MMYLGAVRGEACHVTKDRAFPLTILVAFISGTILCAADVVLAFRHQQHPGRFSLARQYLLAALGVRITGRRERYEAGKCVDERGNRPLLQPSQFPIALWSGRSWRFGGDKISNASPAFDRWRAATLMWCGWRSLPCRIVHPGCNRLGNNPPPSVGGPVEP